MFGKTRHKGVSLVELVIGFLILITALIPVFNLFSNNSRRHEKTKKYSFAHFIGRRAMEQIIRDVQNNASFDNIDHDEPRGVLSNGNYPLSRHFQQFDTSSLGIEQKDYPSLYKELKTYRFKVALYPVDGQENKNSVQRVEIEVLWDSLYSENSSRLVLNTIVSKNRH